MYRNDCIANLLELGVFQPWHTYPDRSIQEGPGEVFLLPGDCPH